MEPVGAMSYQESEGNRHPGFGVVPSKIFPVVVYVVSKAVWLRSARK